MALSSVMYFTPFRSDWKCENPVAAFIVAAAPCAAVTVC